MSIIVLYQEKRCGGIFFHARGMITPQKKSKLPLYASETNIRMPYATFCTWIHK